MGCLWAMCGKHGMGNVDDYRFNIFQLFQPNKSENQTYFWLRNCFITLCCNLLPLYINILNAVDEGRCATIERNTPIEIQFEMETKRWIESISGQCLHAVQMECENRNQLFVSTSCFFWSVTRLVCWWFARPHTQSLHFFHMMHTFCNVSAADESVPGNSTKRSSLNFDHKSVFAGLISTNSRPSS